MRGKAACRASSIAPITPWSNVRRYSNRCDTAWRTHFGTGRANRERRKPRAVGAIVRRLDRDSMRLALMGLVTAATAWAAYVQPGSDQESFFNERFCTQGGFNSGVSDCSFHTWEQCIESAAGLGPLVHQESVLARASPRAEAAGQEPAPQSLKAWCMEIQSVKTRKRRCRATDRKTR